MKAFTIKEQGVITSIEHEEPEMRSVMLPRVPGHEISGIVINKGTDVPDTIAIGDKVTVSPLKLTTQNLQNSRMFIANCQAW